jgi:hypothetical protein
LGYEVLVYDLIYDIVPGQAVQKKSNYGHRRLLRLRRRLYCAFSDSTSMI